MDTALTFEIEADELDVFLQDVNEHLAAMEAGILRLERAADPEALNATFRAAHTLKAVAATVGHHRMTDLTHALEALFDAMREGKLSPTQAMTDTLLATVDGLKLLRDEVVTGKPNGVDVTTLLTRLRALAEGTAGEQNAQSIDDRLSAPGRLTPEQAAQAQGYHEEGHAILEIEITARADAFAPGARLLQAAMALTDVGHIVAQRPSQADLTEDRHDGGLWLILATLSDKDTVEEHLRHVSDLAEFRVRPCRLARAAEVSTDNPTETPAPLPPAPSQSAAGPSSQGEDQTVRISIERLDTLMNLVGELVTDRTRLAQIEDSLHTQYGTNRNHQGDGAMSALAEMATHFNRVVDQLQEEVMQARMLPIAHLFRKFPRLIRDVARASGKQVDLVIEGDTTELDRSIVEVIGDPLIHLLRNAVDHGIEPPQERIAAGKPPTGTVWLTATHEEGHIVITVKDNGRGIDPQSIRQAAVSRGLLPQEEAAQLDDDAVVNLIFQPNLSTAEQVTDVSGRGVGLDVVRTNIKWLSGSVVVESEVGHGTTFRVTLPLTLAIVQAMMVALGDDVYAIPLTAIVETMYLSDVKPDSVKGKPVTQWRGQVLPLVHLRQFFTHPRLAALPSDNVNQAVVTVAWGRLKAGLIVDRLVGKQEIVIKSLGPFIGNVPGLSGCTILGDGNVALIVDVSGLVSACLQTQRHEGTT